MAWSEFVNTLEKMGASVYEAFRHLFVTFNRPVTAIIADVNQIIGITGNPLLQNVLDFINDVIIGNSALGELPLWSFMLGGGLVLVLVINLIKWFIGIVT